MFHPDVPQIVRHAFALPDKSNPQHDDLKPLVQDIHCEPNEQKRQAIVKQLRAKCLHVPVQNPPYKHTFGRAICPICNSLV